MDLRPYQLEAVEALRAKVRAGAKKPLLICPTGGGKTVIFSHVVRQAAELGKRALVLAHRRELVDQASQKLNAFGVQHGIIQAGFPMALHRPVQVASVQTLVARPNVATRVDLVVVDEAHHTTVKNSYAKLLARYPNAIVLGVTATPWRLDGKGLGDVFDEHVIARTPRELRDEGYLVGVGGWEYEAIDTAQARVKLGDYVVADLHASATSRRIVGDAVAEWVQHAGGVRTVLFALNVEHSQTMVDAFVRAGVAAEHLDGEMSSRDRDQVLARLRSGETRIVSNCNVLTEGFDCPELECAILLRPTLSVSLALQMVGRILRPAPGKSVARIHDHAGVLAQHGHPYADRDYSPQQDARGERKKGALTPTAQRRCPACKSVIARWPCDSCNYSPKPQELLVEYEEAARRKEIAAEAAAGPPVPDSDEDRAQRWRKKFARDDDWKFNFLLRMVRKHGVSKGARTYYWFSGKQERAPQEWVRAASEELEREAGPPP